MIFSRENIICLVLLGFLLSANQSFSQRWESLGGGASSPITGTSADVRGLHWDTLNNRLYAVGNFTHMGDSLVYQMAYWDGNYWNPVKRGTYDTICYWGCNPVINVITFNNEVFFSGMSQVLDGDTSIKNNYKWDGTNWTGLGKEYGPAAYSIVNNELYITGIFTPVGTGSNTHNIAKWNGTGFVPIYDDTNFNGAINLVREFQGNLHVAGGFNVSMNNSIRDLAKWNGSNWEQVGGGILGGFGGLHDMEIFKNHLFVAGYFFKSDGNAGNHLMYWDGISWHESLYGIESLTGIYDIDVVNDTMYLTGLFQILPDTINYAAARYDGINFCLYRGHNVPVLEIEKYNNDIIIATNQFIENDTVNFIARWIGGAPDTCLYLPLGMNEISRPVLSGLSIYPNPTENSFTLEFELLVAEDVIIQIVDILGQIISESTINAVPGKNKTCIQCQNWSTGVYFAHVIIGNNHKAIKIIKE